MRRLLKRYLVEDERGALSPMFLALLLGLVLLTGLSLDLLRQEAARADLQNALDRGVLAAADLEQTIDPQVTVSDYVNTRLLSDEPVQLAVVTDEAFNYRRVSASATYEQDTIFLNMWGDPSLPVVGSSAAMERRDDVEISLILDISGSMARERSNGSNESRLEVMKDAAKGFIDLVLVSGSAQSTTTAELTDTLDDSGSSNIGTGTLETTSISLVPYSGQVNAGVLFSKLRSSKYGTQYGKCIEFEDADFTVSGFPEYRSRPQAQQFQNFRYEADYGHDAEWGWCPYNDQGVRPFLNGKGTLYSAIDRFSGHDGTGSQIGMKWGLALLDPSAQPWIESLADKGKVPVEFADRPAAFDSENVLKVVVLMTDGNTRYQPRVKPEYYDTECERNILAHLDENQSTRYKKITSVDFSSCGGSSQVNASTLPNSSYQTTDENFRREQLKGLCDIARLKDIVVFTIGFDISEGSNAYNDMQYCASSESQFYFVEGLELANAFNEIAATISKLKLVE